MLDEPVEEVPPLAGAISGAGAETTIGPAFEEAELAAVSTLAGRVLIPAGLSQSCSLGASVKGTEAPSSSRDSIPLRGGLIDESEDEGASTPSTALMSASDGKIGF